MFSKRQTELLDLLLEQKDTYLKSQDLSFKLNCSLKTIQNELKIIQDLIHNNGAEVVSSTGKGYLFRVLDEKKFELFYHMQKKEIYNETNRISQILAKFMFSSSQYISIEKIASDLYVSLSTIQNDLKDLKSILENFDLVIETKYNRGLRITGSEQNKRKCMICMQLIDNHQPLLSDMLEEVGEIVVQTLTKHKCILSDLLLQNLIFHIILSINRNKSGHFLDLNPQEVDNSINEYCISKEIYDCIQRKYLLQCNENEIAYLSINLKGKRLYEDNSIITDEVNTYVNEVLSEIKTKMNLDLTYDIELRLSLGLHLIPLLHRMKYNMQLKNVMKSDIHKNFILAYDLAVIASNYLMKKTNIVVTDDEMSYLAIHFNLALEKQMCTIQAKRVLIISSSRRGDTLLLKYQLSKRFKDLICDMDVINLNELTHYDIQSYDLCFCTMLTNDKRLKNAIKINYFLEERDYKVIENGLFDIKEKFCLKNMIREELFFSNIPKTNKKELLKFMTDQIKSVESVDIDILQSVLNRERLGFTTYDSLVAIPHTEGMIVDKTIICIALLKEPIEWGNNKVQIVVLVCASSNENKTLKYLYDGISKLIVNRNAIYDIITNQSYKNFIDVFEKLEKEEMQCI